MTPNQHYYCFKILIELPMTRILYNIRRQLLNLKTKGNQIYFQHVPSHKGTNYNGMADSLATKASTLIPSPSSDLNSRDIIRQRSNVNHSKLI